MTTLDPISKRTKARILVVDDHPFLRQGVMLFLNRQPDMVACGEAADAAGAVAGIESCKPDLLLLDLRLGSGDGLELIKSLRCRFPELRILVLSQQDESQYAERSLRAGASGYLMKHEAVEEVLGAIRKILQGEIYVSRKLAASLLGKLLQTTPAHTPAHGLGAEPMDGLSDREFQVFQMLGTGLGSRQIAEQLKLSIKTVETYRENIKHKFSLHNAAELVSHATQWVQGGGAGTLELRAGEGLRVQPPSAE